VLAYIIRTLARIHTVTKNGTPTTLQKAVGPRTNANALAPLGAPLVSGYGRRPTWVAEKTPEVVAANVWRARAHERKTSAARVRNYRVRTFAQQWDVDYRGYPTADAWTSPAVSRFREAIARAKRPRQQEEEGATTSSSSTPTTTGTSSTGGTGSSAPTDAPPGKKPKVLVGGGDPPLPTVTRAFKRARLNQADSDDVTFVPSSSLSASSGMACSGPAPSASSSASSTSKRANEDIGTDGGKVCEQPKRIRAQPSLASRGNAPEHGQRGKCYSCWASIDIRGADTLPRRVRWRGVRPGEPLCTECHRSFLAGRK
jgi:hypothetical protein